MDYKKMSAGLRASMVFSFLLLHLNGLKAQTWSEFFQQKKTQKNYLLEQLVALKVYGGYLEKGYKIAGEGLGFVQGFKNGEFGLHELFFGSLKTISPLITQNPRLASLISMQQEVFRISVSNYADEVFGSAETAFIESVKRDLNKSFEDDLQSLNTLLEAGKLEMSEEERLQAFNRLYNRVHENYLAATGFKASVRLLLVQKKQSLKEFKNMEDHQ